MYANKPIIGIAGGIASGKTHVSRLFGAFGCMVISSDALVRTAYTHPAVKRAIMDMFGEDAFNPGGEVDRAAIGKAVFGDVEKRRQLEQLLHPIVNQVRLQRMQAGGDDPNVRAFVWDSPLLFETGLDKLCTAVVFVDAPGSVRASRAVERGWDEKELFRRENVQWPLDKKREKADYVISNAGADVNAVAVLPETQTSVDAGTTDANRTGGTPNVDAPESTFSSNPVIGSSAELKLKHPDNADVHGASGQVSRDATTLVDVQVRNVLDLILGGGGCEKSAANGGCGNGCRCVAPLATDA
ncbi:MAG: dephospho-CoA kinase [Planctomycetota bacterium]